MTQKLSDLIQRFPWVKFPQIKTKAQVRREAAIKAARTLKRMRQAKASRAAGEAERSAA